ncbi:restriction endonuclease subunit S [Shewanella algae]|uniref:restriction endonuclease subunit S n=1 Tax=Shewanella algae TaxID=38313 RepID=UPI0034D4A5D8
MVPNGWELEKLDDIAKKVMVGIASAATHAYTDSGIRMLRNLNIKDGWIDDSDILHIEEGYEVQHKNKRLKAGDILTVRTGYPGLSAVVPSMYENAQCFTSLVTRLDQTRALPDYVCRFINSEYGKKFISSGEAGGAQKNVNAAMLKKMPIPLPPLPEQRKIAKILSTWDKAIATNEKLIATSKQQKKALMQQLLTGKKRLVNPETGKAFEGEWEEVKLSQIANITMGSSPKSESYNENGKGLPLLQGNADIKSRKSAPRIHTSQITKECEIGDILLSVRAPVGSVAKSLHNACIGRGIAGIQAKRNVAQEFLYQWLLAFEPKWERFSQGSTFEAVNSNDIKTLHISAPSYLEQQKISSVLTAADKEIEVLEAKLAHFKQEKKALMQQLLTGKRRVSLSS